MSLLAPYLRRGWLEYPDRLHPTAVSLYAPIAERGNLLDCECNEKPPGLYLREYPDYHMVLGPTYEVELCGQRDGIWLKFQCYNLVSAYDIEKGIASVRSAW